MAETAMRSLITSCKCVKNETNLFFLLSKTVKVIDKCGLSQSRLRQRFTNSLHIHLPLTPIEPSLLQSIKDICSSNKGNCSLFLHLKTSRYNEVIVQANPDTKVAPTEELISQIEHLVGEQSVSLSNSSS